MVKTGCEDRFKDAAAEKLASKGDFSKLYFFKKQMKSRAGSSFLEPLFPGYIFMETEKLEYSSIDLLKKINGFYHFLFNNVSPQRIQGEDLEYYSAFRKNGEILGLSKVSFDENQRIVIVDGPLKGFEGKIIRVNRRCQRVTISIDMFSDQKKVDLCYSEVAGI